MVVTENNTPASPKLSGPELKEALKTQVEYYFSRENLTQDAYLLSKMDQNHFVDLSVISNFKLVKAMTEDTSVLIDAIKASSKLTLDEAQRRVKPAVVLSRNTVILRNISSTAAEGEVRTLLQTVSMPAIVSLRADIGDNWYATFETEEAAKQASVEAKKLKYNGKAVGAAIKCENLMKGLIPGVAMSAFPPVMYHMGQDMRGMMNSGGDARRRPGTGDADRRGKGKGKDVKEPKVVVVKQTPPTMADFPELLGESARSLSPKVSLPASTESMAAIVKKKAAMAEASKPKEAPKPASAPAKGKDATTRGNKNVSKEKAAPSAPKDSKVKGGLEDSAVSDAATESGGSTPPPEKEEVIAKKEVTAPGPAKMSYAQMALASKKSSAAPVNE